MKTKITKTIIEEIEVTFPFYKKTIAHRYKIIDENNTICVMRGFKDKTFCIEKRDYLSEDIFLKHDCTESEFMEWFNETILLITESVNQHTSQGLETTNDTHEEYMDISEEQCKLFDEFAESLQEKQQRNG